MLGVGAADEMSFANIPAELAANVWTTLFFPVAALPNSI